MMPSVRHVPLREIAALWRMWLLSCVEDKKRKPLLMALRRLRSRSMVAAKRKPGR
jgi:hypothetical protein